MLLGLEGWVALRGMSILKGKGGAVTAKEVRKWITKAKSDKEYMKIWKTIPTLNMSPEERDVLSDSYEINLLSTIINDIELFGEGE